MSDAASAKAQPPPSAERLVHQRVLVVDDDLDSAEVLTELLVRAGHQTRFALDGPNAITMARDFRPQVVILDLVLGEMDGYEVARRLRLEHGLSSMLLVALTGWSGAEWERKAREVGFDRYIVKPLPAGALQELLEASARMAR